MLARVVLKTETWWDRHFEEGERQLAALDDLATGMLAEPYARIVDCSVCGSAEWQALLTNGRFTVVSCNACDVGFSNPKVRRRHRGAGSRG